MVVQRLLATDQLIDVLDRIFDRGIVIDASVRIALVGIDFAAGDLRMVVASREPEIT